MATNDDWLALAQEDTLEPDLPICDSHHHLWDNRPDLVEPRYLLDEILTDLNSGHNIISTVFVQCGAMHKADGPEAMRVVGESEFVNGIAARSASGAYGPTRIAAGIDRAVTSGGDEAVLAAICEEVREFCTGFPLPH